jgi:pyruvate,water dikinase
MRLKEFMRQPDRDLDAELAGQAAAREAALAEVRDRLRDYPEAVVGQFEFLLKAAQESTVLTEVHNYWIDFRSVHAMRMIVLEFGRRLAETGVIASRDDVFFLSLDEARDSLVSPGRDLRSVVETRKAELAWAKTIQPPPALGTLPPGPPPDDPMSRSNVRFFGAAPPPSPEPGVIVGQAGSPGIARGRARIIQAAAEADRLQPGDILVTQATAPPWTPLFATIGAVVTDTGGILSHSAVVAREYGIPAVVGTGLASFSIQDGQMIEVNGSDGIVRIVDAD